MQCVVAAPHEDPFFFDREGLEAVADTAVVGEGLRCFKEHRVIAVDQDQELLWAQVEDKDSVITSYSIHYTKLYD